MTSAHTVGRAKPGIPALHIASPFATLRGRIIAGFALLIVITALGAAGSAWQARAHQSELAEMESAATTVSLLQRADRDTALVVALLELHASTGDETTIPEIRSNLAAAKEDLLAAKSKEQALGHEGQVAMFAQYLTGLGVTSDVAEQDITLRQRGDVQGAAMGIALAAPGLLSAHLEFDRFVEVQRQDQATFRSEADRSGEMTFWFAVLDGIAGAVMAGAASVLIARSALLPLRRLELAAMAVAVGDLKARAPVTGPRELARVGASFNQMTGALLALNSSLEQQVIERTRELRAREARYGSLTENMFDLVLEAGVDEGSTC